jgi:hypothetical protein
MYIVSKRLEDGWLIKTRRGLSAHIRCLPDIPELVRDGARYLVGSASFRLSLITDISSFNNTAEYAWMHIMLAGGILVGLPV